MCERHRLRSRPCRICRKWFVPKKECGNRQKVCGAHSCQRERQRRNDRDWHARHPTYDKERRLREKLSKATPNQTSSSPKPPLFGLDLEVLQEVGGLEVAVIIELALTQLARFLQEPADPKPYDPKAKSRRHALVSPQDHIPEPRHPPENGS